MFEGTGYIQNASDKNIAYRRQRFMNTGTWTDGTCAYRYKTYMFLRTKRGIHCDIKRRGMSFFYLFQGGFEIQCMNRLIQCTVYINIFPVISGKLVSHQRTKTISGDSVTSDTYKDNFVPWTIYVSNTFS